MADNITWRLTGDASQVKAEMATAMRVGQQGADDIGRAFDKVDGHHEKLLRSSHRVSRQIVNVSKDMLTGASAADVLAGSLEGIGRSLNLSLGSLAALGLGGLAVQQIYQLHEALKKANEEVDKLLREGSGSGDFKSLANLEMHLKKVNDEIARLEKENKGGMGQRIMDAFGENFFTEDGEMLPDSGKADRRRASQLSKLSADRDKTSYAESDKLARANAIKRAELDGAPSWQKKAADLQIAHDEANTPVSQLNEAAIKLKLAFEELAKTVNDKKLERSGMSLKELAAIPEASGGYNADGTAWTISYEKWKAGQDARSAMALDAQGESARQNFDPEGANQNFNAAGEIKDNITNLKPSEKMSSDLKGALQVTEEQLTIIAENTTGMFKGR